MIGRELSKLDLDDVNGTFEMIIIPHIIKKKTLH
jgi:hypothetical protein